MRGFVDAQFRAGLLLFLVQSLTCLEDMEFKVHRQCTQTGRNSLYSTPKVTVPIVVDAIGVVESLSEFQRLKIDLCPDSRFLKISWIINRTDDCDLMVCYRMENNKAENLLDTVCYNLHLHQSNFSSAMNCWFPMRFIDRKPTITAWTLPTRPSTQGIFYGSLDTGALDPDNTCSDICEVVEMKVGSQVNCQHTSVVMYDSTSYIEHLSFHTKNKSYCNNGIKVLNKTDGQLEYKINCSFNGAGFIKILYRTKGKYCLKYQMVNVVCNQERTSKITDERGINDAHSFGTFMIFGLVCLLVIAATFFTVIYVVQWVYGRTHTLKSNHHRRHSAAAGAHHHVTIKTEEKFPLAMFSPQPSGSRQNAYSINTDSMEMKNITPRKRSASVSSTKMPEEEDLKRGLLVLPMRKSITMALLEDTDPFYKKRILFLPIPFDHFTNEVTKILKSVFMDEAGIPSQCCFDRKIFQEYMTGDKFKWLDNVLSDHDKILIFICFTSINPDKVDVKRDSMAEEVLDNLLSTKVKSHRLCKVVLLYLTDSPNSVQNVGDIVTDSFHINSATCYANFVGNVMNFCGRNPEANSALIKRITNSQASKHFLSFIGKKGNS
ncbi:uncharacterized protein LOC132715475 isoform X2 [Ruditapes philippinarum]|uniref:uncharacterized protein LOC132715475 isoform X2 n=1 Tax=Ruditapes philippinarum TaxID=129788 RepID=UPI00295C1DB2|nr:uncharacterized protein LOC132715475 isoform X2 [Ruditapes philippinarum]